ncbi:hypothetical protein ZIOFF_064791 [Zingiber officinale]|uniref:NB-ARC domain-containing protein n=1 Tax=Zingiber officinale TaxID=94328 RepID=A0A8J5KCT0_ZINOF|nr:hypothetical protein ZIOFF_064791 [Zingiber officinale]
MATISQLRHILMKILPAPEMVAQGKAFRISNHLEMIQDCLWAINSFLMDAALRVLTEHNVEEWMEDVGVVDWMKDVGVAVEDVDSLLKRILDYWEPNEQDEAKKKKKMSNFFHPLVNINNNIQSTSSRQAILVELKETACLLNYLVKRGTALGLWAEMMDSMDPCHDDYAAILSKETMGRQEDEDQIIELLRQQHCDEDGNVPFIIDIRGEEFSGRTTLARKIYHHPWVRQHFQHRIWLDASSFREFNSKMIAKEIARLLTGKACANINCWPLIIEHLRGDRYLLILDDADVPNVFRYKWEEFKLNLLHCGAPGSRVILARHTFAGNPYGGYGIEFNVKKYKLKELPEDAWVRILLRYATFAHSTEGNNNIHKEKASPSATTNMLIPLAKKCRLDHWHRDRNLLIAKGVGLMFRWKDRNEWQELPDQLYRFEILHCYFLLVHQQYGSFENIRPSLYNLLLGESEAESFGEAESYGEDVLYMLIAEGILTNTRLTRNIQYIGSEFNLDPCFFRMKVSEDSSIPPQCRHLYLPIHSKNVSKSKKAIEKAGVANKLRTLVLHREEEKGHTYHIETKKFEGMFLNLTCLCTLHMRAIMIQDLPITICTLHCLRYLNLAENKIETLPESLCNLSNLCVLILSLCKKLKELPRQIYKLRKLQILKLSYCQRIQKLPESITRLMNLKELDVGGCCWLSKLPDDLSDMKNLVQLNMLGCASLTRMPGGIRQLTNLEVLCGYDAIDGLGNAMLSELRDLTNLESLHIQHLERLVSAEAKEPNDITAPPTILQENQHVNELMLHWEWWNDMVAEETFEPTLQLTQGFHRNIEELKILRIVSYMSIKLPGWLIREESTSVLNKLTTVHLVNLRRCERLPSLGNLPNLKELAISGFDSIRLIDDDFYGEGSSALFPGLRRLTFSQMPRLEKWDPPSYFKEKSYQFRDRTFHFLEELTLIQCPKFREFHMPICVSHTSRSSLKVWLSNEMLMPTSKFNDWGNLCGIQSLQIFGCQELRSLPDGLKTLLYLDTLVIINCNKLEALPIWLEQSRLESLCVYGCPALSIIPEGLKVTGRLRNLIVEACACPKLHSQVGSAQQTLLLSILYLLTLLFQFRGHKVKMREHHQSSTPTFEELLSAGVGFFQVLSVDCAVAERVECATDRACGRMDREAEWLSE